MARRRKVRGVVVQEIAEGRLGSRVRITAKRPVLELDFLSMSRLAWYAVLVRPQAEFLVEANLERRGLAALVPMRKRERRINPHTTKKIDVFFPLAPGYVFVGLPGETDAERESLLAARDAYGLAPDMRTDEDRAALAAAASAHRAVLARRSPAWGKLFGLTWVRSAVSLDGVAPTRMDGLQVARFIVANMVVDERPVPDVPIAADEDVLVLDGPFAGHQVKVHAIDGEVARVLLPLFGAKDMTASIKVSSLKRAG